MNMHFLTRECIPSQANSADPSIVVPLSSWTLTNSYVPSAFHLCSYPVTVTPQCKIPSWSTIFPSSSFMPNESSSACCNMDRLANPNPRPPSFLFISLRRNVLTCPMVGHAERNGVVASLATECWTGIACDTCARYHHFGPSATCAYRR